MKNMSKEINTTGEYNVKTLNVYVYVVCPLAPRAGRSEGAITRHEVEAQTDPTNAAVKVPIAFPGGEDGSSIKKGWFML